MTRAASASATLAALTLAAVAARAEDDDAPPPSEPGHELPSMSEAFPSAAPPPEPPAKERGLAVGARVGLAKPSGNAFGASGGQSEVRMTDVVSSIVPIWIDVGYRFTPRVFVGVYAAYALGNVNPAICSPLPSSASCSVSDVRFGLEALYHFAPLEPIDPWLGFGVGREALDFSVSGAGAGGDGDASLAGWELADLQLGADYRLGPSGALGAFLSVSVARFSSETLSMGGASQSASIDAAATHVWLTFGMRGEYDF